MSDRYLVFFLIGYFICYLTGILISFSNLIFNKAMIIRKQRREYEKK